MTDPMAVNHPMDHRSVLACDGRTLGFTGFPLNKGVCVMTLTLFVEAIKMMT